MVKPQWPTDSLQDLSLSGLCEAHYPCILQVSTLGDAMLFVVCSLGCGGGSIQAPPGSPHYHVHDHTGQIPVTPMARYGTYDNILGDQGNDHWVELLTRGPSVTNFSAKISLRPGRKTSLQQRGRDDTLGMNPVTQGNAVGLFGGKTAHTRHGVALTSAHRHTLTHPPPCSWLRASSAHRKTLWWKRGETSAARGGQAVEGRAGTDSAPG